MADHGPLSEREVEILRLVATGASNKEIARQLGISANTVKVHLRNIFEKSGAASRTEATLYAIRAGLVEGVESTLVTPARHWWQRGWVIAGGALVLTIVAFVVGALVKPGGSPSENVVDLAQLEGERWQELAPMPTARQGLAVVAYDGMIYAIAGETEDGVTDVVERYDPATDTWETLPSKPTAVTDVQAAVIGGKIYVPGGRSASGKATDVLELYDPRSGSWETASHMPRALALYALEIYEGRLFLFGGWDGHAHSERVYSFNPGIARWSQETSMLTPKSRVKAVSFESGIYLVDGQNSTGFLREFDVYQPNLDDAGQDPWQRLEPLPSSGDRIEAVSVADILYVLQGDSMGTMLLEYPLREPAWRAGDLELPLSAPELHAVNLGEYLYILGSGGGEEVPVQFYRYRAVYRIFLPISTNQ